MSALQARLFPGREPASPGVIFSRAWCMPSADTFSMAPALDFCSRWLHGAAVIVDPFARNSRIGTLRNDLNPATLAEHHMGATDFLRSLDVVADAAIFDPPYSPRQIAECYAAAGLTPGMADTQSAAMKSEARDLITGLLRPGGVALSFGWNSVGFGTGRGFALIEVLLICHGGDHNDTICIAERKG